MLFCYIDPDLRSLQILKIFFIRNFNFFFVTDFVTDFLTCAQNYLLLPQILFQMPNIFFITLPSFFILETQTFFKQCNHLANLCRETQFDPIINLLIYFRNLMPSSLPMGSLMIFFLDPQSGEPNYFMMIGWKNSKPQVNFHRVARHETCSSRLRAVGHSIVKSLWHKQLGTFVDGCS